MSNDQAHRSQRRGPSPLTALRALDVAEIFSHCAEAISAHAGGLDAINVFPVADNDTGTNLASTAAALRLAAEGSASFADLAGSLTAAALSGAKGNSGLIFGQFVAGWIDVVRNVDSVDAERFALALEAGAERARAAMGTPVEGTILTVIDAAAAAGLARCDARGSLADVVEAAHGAGLDALEATPTQLAVLAEAGVVDAGAAGWLIWLEVVLSVVSGEPIDGAADPAADLIVDGAFASEPPREGPQWEVMFSIELDDADASRLSSVLSAIGESVGVGRGDDDERTVHVHADDIGAVIEAALAVGRPRRIRVESLDG